MWAWVGVSLVHCALCARLLIYELQKDVVKLRLPDTLNIVHRSNRKKKPTSQSVGVSVCCFCSYCLFAVSTEPILWPNWAKQHLIHRNNATTKKRAKQERYTFKIKHTKNLLDISLIYFTACSDLCSLWK